MSGGGPEASSAYEVGPDGLFDTLTVRVGSGKALEIHLAANAKKINLRRLDHETIGVSLDETTDVVDLQDLWSVFNQGQPLGFDPVAFASDLSDFPVTLARETPFLTHPVFNKYHTETEMLRYLRRLEAKDLSLTTSMIPLGSCTMKLNATTRDVPRDVAGVRQDASVRARRAGGGLPHAWPMSWRNGSARSPDCRR